MNIILYRRLAYSYEYEYNKGPSNWLRTTRTYLAHNVGLKSALEDGVHDTVAAGRASSVITWNKATKCKVNVHERN